MTNNMTEIKQSKIKLFIGWIVSHAVSIGLIGIGLALFLSSCQKVKADEITGNIKDVCYEQFEYASNFNTVKPILDYVIETCPYFVYFPGNVSGGGNGFCIQFYVEENTYCSYGDGDSTSYNGTLSTYPFVPSNKYVCTFGDYSNVVYPTYNGVEYISFEFIMTNNAIDVLGFQKTTFANSYNTTMYYADADNHTFNGMTGTSISVRWNTGTITRIINTGASVYMGSYYYDTVGYGALCYINGRYLWCFKPASEFVPITFVEDDRLKITTVNDVYGQKNLFIDIREFIDDFPISDTSGSSNWLDNDTLILTLVRDMIPEEVRLNSLNSTIKSKYIFETPYSLFNVSDDEELYISDVSFSISGSGQSVPLQTETYNILCEYWLNQIYTKPEQAVIPRDNDVDGTKMTQVEYDNVTGKVNFSDGYYSPLGGGGNELVVPYGYNVLYVTITGSRTLASIINEIVTDNYLEILLASGDPMTDVELSIYLAKEITSSISGITSTEDAESLIKEYIMNNYYTNMFDIVVYYWAPDSSLGEVDVMYYYLTESGRLRGISQILSDVYRESNQISVNTKATYEFLYDKLNDFENMTLEAIWGDSPFSVFNSIDKLDNDLLSSVSRIIESMPTYTPYDDFNVVYYLGEIKDLLDTVIANQESPQDGYPKYIAWVKDFDDLDGFGDWSESVLDTFKNIYSFFNYREDINVMETGLQTYVYYVDEYVRMLLGNTESDLDITKRYYMSIFDNTYDIHNINGGGS